MREFNDNGIVHGDPQVERAKEPRAKIRLRYVGDMFRERGGDGRRSIYKDFVGRGERWEMLNAFVVIALVSSLPLVDIRRSPWTGGPLLL